MCKFVTSLKAIRDAAEGAIQLAQDGKTAEMLGSIDFMADQGKSIVEQVKQLRCECPGTNPKMSPQKAALHIQRYATEAIEGLRTQGATADTEHRLVDIRALAQDITKDLKTIQAESSESAES